MMVSVTRAVRLISSRVPHTGAFHWKPDVICCQTAKTEVTSWTETLIVLIDSVLMVELGFTMDRSTALTDLMKLQIAQIRAFLFVRNRTRCVTREMLNDGVLDCKGPEGPLDETLGSLESFDCPINVTIGYANILAPRCVLFYDNF